MKKTAPLLLLLMIAACRNGKNAPDVSNIAVTVSIERFDKAFFELDSNNIAKGMYDLNRRFPYFTNDFVENILGAGPLTDTNRVAFVASRQFLVSYLPAKDAIEAKFENMKPIEKELQKGFQHMKYYFPNYKLPPKVVAYIGPFDAPGIAITQYTLAIGLQLFAGKDFSYYKSMQGQELYPAYISRRFEAAYIVPNCMKALTEDLFPDRSMNKSLIAQMIEKGKYWWLIDQLLPETADSLKTGFTEKQLGWCKANEGLIWNFFLQNDIFTVDPELIKDYIGDAPYTQGMPEASPGNIGQWVGWQIVKKYAADHPSITPDGIMKTDARKIFDESKYKPK